MKTMIKNLPVMAACLLFAGTAMAQDKNNAGAPKATASNFSIGVKGGTQFSSFSRFAPVNARIGWNAGLTMTYSAWEHWGLGGDVLYTRTGGYYSADRPTGDTRHTVRTDYVRFVPKVTYFFMDLDDAIRPKLFVGPNFGVLTMARDKNRNWNLYDEYRPVEFGVTVGTGFNWRMARAIWLNVDVEYLVGISRINSIRTYDPYHLRTNSLSASVGVAFGINRLGGR